MAATGFLLPAISERRILNPRSSAISCCGCLNIRRNFNFTAAARSPSSGKYLRFAKFDFLHLISDQERQILNPQPSTISCSGCLNIQRKFSSPSAARSSSSGKSLRLANSELLYLISDQELQILNPRPSAISSHSCRNHRRALNTPAATRSSSSGKSLRLAKSDLLDLISDQERGVRTEGNAARRSEIIQAIDTLSEYGKNMVTSDSSLSDTWRLLWTTEKEQLFIIKNANLFGTKTGDVLQVIDIENGLLNNVITFPPSGVFFVRSTCKAASNQRVNFRFTGAVLRGDGWQIPLPPFGQGWFESVYLDEDIRIAKDIRGDYLIVDRAPYAWTE